MRPGGGQNPDLTVTGVFVNTPLAMSGAEKRLPLSRGVLVNRRGLESTPRARRWLYGLAAAAAVSIVIAATMASDSQPWTGPVPAERLVIQYQSGSFQLLSRSRLIKVLPPSDQLPATNGAVSGFWFEVQTPKAELKYRRIMANPIAVHTEVPDPTEGSQPTRREILPDEVVFTLLIPQEPGSNNLVLVGSPLGPEGKAKPAQTLARIPLPEQAK